MLGKVSIIVGNIGSFGGAERWVLELNEAVHKQVDISVITPATTQIRRTSIEKLKKKYKHLPRILGVDAITLFGLPVFPKPSSLGRVIKEIKESRVVYIATMSPPLSYLIALIAVLFARNRCIFAFHNNYLADELYRHRVGIYKPFNMLRLRFLIHFINNFHVLNSEDYAKTRKLRPGASVHLIPNFLPDSDAKKVRINGREFLALFVGRLSPHHKGIDLLARIIEKLEGSRAQGKMTFHIIGSGGKGEEIAERVSKLYKNVEWLGFVSDRKLVEELSAASLLLFTSRYETFGVTLVEAQGHGLPVIAFDVRGPRDLIKNRDQGELIRPFDVDAFARAILRYYDLWCEDKGKYYKIKLRIADRVRGEYGSKTIVPRLMKMFSDVGG